LTCRQAAPVDQTVHSITCIPRVSSVCPWARSIPSSVSSGQCGSLRRPASRSACPSRQPRQNRMTIGNTDDCGIVPPRFVILRLGDTDLRELDSAEAAVEVVELLHLCRYRSSIVGALAQPPCKSSSAFVTNESLRSHLCCA